MTGGSAPAVSVVVVTRDRPWLLAQSLASLAAQTVTPEVVLVRAAGDTTSDDVLGPWRGVLARVVRAEHGERATARNAGIAVTTGEYVMFLDDDDLLDRGALELLCAVARERGAAIVRGGRQEIPAGTDYPWQPLAGASQQEARHIGWQELVVGSEILTPSQTIFRRDLVAGRICFEEQFVPIEDFVFGAVAGHAAGGFVAVAQVTTGYRVHDAQSGARYRPEEVSRRQLAARHRLFNVLPVDRATRRRSMAHYHLFVEAATQRQRGRPWRMVPAAGRAATSSPAIILTSMWWKALSLPARQAMGGSPGAARLAPPPPRDEALVTKVQPHARRWRQSLEGRRPESLLVSVVIPAHNEPVYLRQAIDSLLVQTHRHLEVIVVDDASDPPMGGIVSGFGDPRLGYLRLSGNRERAGARNVGLSAAHGDFFLLLDHDDVLDPEAIETLVSVALSAGADVVFGRTETIPAGTVLPWRSAASRNPGDVEEINWTDIFRFRWPIGNALYASWYVREISFLHRAIPADDYQFAMEAALLGRAVRTNVPVAGWRQHPRQTTASLDGRAVSLAVKRAQDVVLATYTIPRPTRRRMLGYRALYQDGYVAWRSGQWGRLARAGMTAAWNDPNMLGDAMWWKSIGAAGKQALLRRPPRHGSAPSHPASSEPRAAATPPSYG